MSTAPKIIPTVHEIENVLAFTQEKIVMAGKTETFGTLDTSRFDKIRLVAANEQSTCDVHVSLKVIEEPDGERFFLDQFTLSPQNQLTRVYDVPGTKVEVTVAGLLGRPRATQAEVEILIFGQY